MIRVVADFLSVFPNLSYKTTIDFMTPLTLRESRVFDYKDIMLMLSIYKLWFTGCYFCDYLMLIRKRLLEEKVPVKLVDFYFSKIANKYCIHIINF